MRQRGSASVVVLALLLFVSALFLAAGGLVRASRGRLSRSQERERETDLVRQAAERLVQALLDDPTPFADSRRDPVWAMTAARDGEGISLELADLSSRLGLNWVRAELVGDMDVLKPGKSPRDLQQFREERGIRLELEPSCLDFFQAEDLAELFTPYGYFNINVCDEQALRQLYEARAKDGASAEGFLGMIREARRGMRDIGAADLEEALGAASYRVLFPLVNAEPPINVHHAPERVLRALFIHHGLPVEIVDRIVSSQASSEWTLRDLQELVGSARYEASALRHYLGLVTWFWRIEATGPEVRLSWVVARVPDPEGGPVQYRLVEEAVTP